jgi:microcin C transport system substrate-binding protein
MVGRAVTTLLLLLFGNSLLAAEWRHGMSFFGDLKYPPGFTHFDYVNPDAPKTGEIKLPQLGNFDNLNFFIRKGREPTGMGYDQDALIYDRLMFKADDEPASQYGWLAEAVRLADDYSWVEFRLRDEARWHDGTPVTADDVVYTFERLKEEGSPVLRLEFSQVESAEIINNKQVKFYLRDATSPKAAQSVANMWVLPKHYWETRDFGSTTLDIPLGSGAYRITEVDPGRKIVYERVDDYWGKDIAVMKGRFNFDRVVYDYFSDENVIHEAHKAGVVDARLEGVAKRWATEYDFPGYRDGYFIKDLIVTERPFGMAFGLLFNLRMEKFRDARVREAIALAYDFEWNNRVLNHSFYERVDSFFENSDLAQTGLPSEAELALLEPFRGQIPERVFTEPYVPTRTSGRGYARANLLEAARLLKEAGYDVVDGVLVDHATGRPFTIEFLTVSVYLERFLMPLVASLERLGIFSTVRTVEVSQYINRVGKFDFEGSLRTYSQTLVPGTELRNYWGSDAAERIYSRNTPGIKDPVVDALIETIIGSRSREELIAACRALDRVMLWNFYAIPGFFPPGYRYGYWDKFEKPEIQARYRSGFFDTWWYSEEKARQVAIGMQRMQKGEY